MYNDIEWKAKRNEEQCEYNSQTVANSARKFFRGPGSEEKWYGTYTDKPDGSWDRIAEEMMANFSESGNPIFRASSVLREETEARSQYTSMVVMKTSSCFSAQ